MVLSYIYRCLIVWTAARLKSVREPASKEAIFQWFFRKGNRLFSFLPDHGFGVLRRSFCSRGLFPDYNGRLYEMDLSHESSPDAAGKESPGIYPLFGPFGVDGVVVESKVRFILV